MTGSSYKLSCDEQQALKQRVLAALRVQRLKEVRAQDRQLAKQRARAYKDLCVDSAQQLQSQLISLITQQRETELAVLKAQYEDALAGLARAQQQAAETEQDLALQAQQKQQLYLQRQAEAQERFTAALTQVRNARQSELQAVLDRVQRRQLVMEQERGKARGFAEQAKEAAALQAQRQAELNLQEEQRRRQNKVSRIDFKYSRLHELGVPHLVVNHRELPQQGADAASQAQLEAERLREEQQAQAQQQQEYARRAADRGVSAHRLLQAEQNRRRMEQALKELESNEVQQRKQQLAPDKLTAAPLLRKWHKQKVQAKARLAFERDFLPDSSAAQQGLPSFLTTEPNTAQQQQAREAQQQHQRPQSPARQTVTAADRALKLVQELERQRRAEAAAAEVDREQQQQQQRAAARAAVAAAAVMASSTVSSGESEVPVDDLITFIPPVSTAEEQRQPPTPTLAPEEALAAAAAAAAAAAHAVGTATTTEPSRSSASLTDILEGGQQTSTASVLQDTSLTSSVLESLRQSLTSPAAEPAAAAGVESSSSEQPLEPAAQDSSVGAVAVTASNVSEESATSSTQSSASAAAAAAAAAAPSGSPAIRTAAVGSSRDSLEAIIAAADEVLRQLPADMQAAAAARAAAAAVPAPRPQQPQLQAIQQPADTLLRPAVLEELRSSAEQGMRASAQRVATGRAADSSMEAAAILSELRALQQQLGVQVLNTQSSDSALAELQSFDADIERIAAQQLSAQPQMTQHTQPAQQTAGARVPVASGAAAAATGGASSSGRKRISSAAVGLSEVLSTARQQLQAAAAAEQQQQREPEVQPPVRTELDDLIDRILAPDYPSNVLHGALAGPVPSTSSPTRPAGRSGRMAAAQDRSSRQQQGARGPAAAAATAGAGAGAGGAARGQGQTLAQGQSEDDTELLERLKALGMELQGLGLSGDAGVAGNRTAQAGPAAGEPGGRVRKFEGTESTSSLTLPTTILEATTCTQQQQRQRRAAQVPPLPPRGPSTARDSSSRGSAGPADSRQRLASVSVSTSAPSLSGLLQKAQETLAAAAAAGIPGAAAAAAGGGYKLNSSVSASSDSTWSLTASQEASLLTLERMLAADIAAPMPAGGLDLGAGVVGVQPAAGVDLQQQVAAGWLQVAAVAPSSVVSLPSTLLRAGPAESQQVGSSSSAAQAAMAATPQPPAAAEADAVEQGTYELLRGLLSLSGSSSSSSGSESPAGSTGAAAAAAGTTAAAAAGTSGGQGGLLSASVSSALSSMSDRELELLLQRAMAATGYDGTAAGAATGGLGGLGGAGTSDVGPTAAPAGVSGLDMAEGPSAGDIEAALEAMLAAGGPAGALQHGPAAVPFDQASGSTTLPSTIWRGMQQQQQQEAVVGAWQTTVQQAGAPPAPPPAAAGPSRAVSALQRAKRSSRARAAETASTSGSSGDSVISGTSSGSNGLGGLGDLERSSGDTSSGSSGSLSIPQMLGVGVGQGVLEGPGSSSSIAGFAVGDGGSCGLSIPSTVQHAMSAGAAAGAQAQAQLQQQQQPVGCVEARGGEGMLLAPIQEEGEASSSIASELLSASTQEIDALLARLAEEQRQAGITTGSDAPSGSSSRTSSSSGEGMHPITQQAATSAPPPPPAAAIGAAAGRGVAHGSSSGREGSGGSSGVAQGASSSSRQDTMASSDSFSEVVSSLMLHIDSTIASLAAGAAGPGASQRAPAAPAAGSSGVRGGVRGAVNPQQQQQQQQQASFSLGASSSSSSGGSTISSAMASTPAGPTVRTHTAAAAGGGGESSSSAAGLSGGLGSGLGLSGVSSDTPTDSSTKRYVQQVLQGVMSSSTGATGTTAVTGTSGSPDLGAVSSRPTRGPAAPGNTRRQQQQQQQGRPSGAPLGGLLSPESTGASEFQPLSSGDTAELLAGMSSGSMTIGPTSSSSSAGSGAQRQQQTTAPAQAPQPQQQWSNPPAGVLTISGGLESGSTSSLAFDTSSLGLQGGSSINLQTSAGVTAGTGFGSVGELAALERSGSVSAISSALRAAAETRSAGFSFGDLLSPEASSASEGASRQTQPVLGAAVAAAADTAISGRGVAPPLALRSAGGMPPVPLDTNDGSAQPLPPTMQGEVAQQQQQQQGVGVERPVGLSGLLADIVAEDPVLARQLQQQQQQR